MSGFSNAVGRGIRRRNMRTRKLFEIKDATVLFRPGSLWVGAHWSPKMRQWCINLIPCVTIRVRLK